MCALSLVCSWSTWGYESTDHFTVLILSFNVLSLCTTELEKMPLNHEYKLPVLVWGSVEDKLCTPVILCPPPPLAEIF